MSNVPTTTMYVQRSEANYDEDAITPEMIENAFTEEEVESMYRDMLRDAGDVIVLGVAYDAARALRELDPIRYQVGLSECLDEEFFEVEV